MYDYEAIQHHIEQGNLPKDYDGSTTFSLRAIRRALAETDFSGLEPQSQERYRRLQETVCQPGVEDDILSHI